MQSNPKAEHITKARTLAVIAVALFASLACGIGAKPAGGMKPCGGAAAGGAPMRVAFKSCGPAAAAKAPGVPMRVSLAASADAGSGALMSVASMLPTPGLEVGGGGVMPGREAAPG